jgi:hypothetical protein
MGRIRGKERLPLRSVLCSVRKREVAPLMGSRGRQVGRPLGGTSMQFVHGPTKPPIHKAYRGQGIGESHNLLYLRPYLSGCTAFQYGSTVGWDRVKSSPWPS